MINHPRQFLKTLLGILALFVAPYPSVASPPPTAVLPIPTTAPTHPAHPHIATHPPVPATDHLTQQPASILGNQTPPQHCPSVKELGKEETHWVVGDQWKSQGESFAHEIHSFMGAQWVGIKVGKIICIYQGKASFDFPVALEQIRGRIVLEPFGLHWSGLTNNRKFCKSVNVFDCPFLKQEVSETSIHEALKYRGDLPQPQGDAASSDF